MNLPDLRHIKGRRNRVLRSLVYASAYEGKLTLSLKGKATAQSHDPILLEVEPDAEVTMEMIVDLLKDREELTCLPLRVSPTVTVNVNRVYLTKDDLVASQSSRDSELPECLIDLAWEVVDDVTEACGVLDNPNLYYEGVVEGIESVTDEHVELVIAAMQRELNRELRPFRGSPHFPVSGPRRPAVVLEDLPKRIQRALAQRRRYRFKQYGIGRDEWLANAWSVWNVSEDSEWLPRRATSS